MTYNFLTLMFFYAFKTFPADITTALTTYFTYAACVLPVCRGLPRQHPLHTAEKVVFMFACHQAPNLKYHIFSILLNARYPILFFSFRV